MPAKLSMHVPFNPDNDDHWLERPDLGSLWYDREAHGDYNTWSVTITHWPYDKRRFRAICALSHAVRPSHDVNRWRNRVDEDRYFH